MGRTDGRGDRIVELCFSVKTFEQWSPTFIDNLSVITVTHKEPCLVVSAMKFFFSQSIEIFQRIWLLLNPLRCKLYSFKQKPSPTWGMIVHRDKVKISPSNVKLFLQLLSLNVVNVLGAFVGLTHFSTPLRRDFYPQGRSCTTFFLLKYVTL